LVERHSARSEGSPWPLIDAIDIKRKMFFELDGTPLHCLDVEVTTATAVAARHWSA
jgi:hypothetical protein